MVSQIDFIVENDVVDVESPLLNLNLKSGIDFVKKKSK